MKLIALSILLASLLVIKVDSQCLQLVKEFYRCNMSTVVDPIDSVYETNLAGIDTFDKAMDYFRNIYQFISGCQTPVCKCIKENTRVEMNYEPIFLNDKHFEDLKRIINGVKPYTLRTIPEINTQTYFENDTQLAIFGSSTPWYNNFCHKYEYDSYLRYFFIETKDCYKKPSIVEIAKCVALLGDKDKVEVAIKCKLNLLKEGCPMNAKKLFALYEVMLYPNVVTESTELYSWVERLANSAFSNLHIFKFSFLIYLPVFLLFYFKF